MSATAGSDLWASLSPLAREKAEDRAFLEVPLVLWCRLNGLPAAAVYVEQEGGLQRALTVGEGRFPLTLGRGEADGLGQETLAGGAILFPAAGRSGERGGEADLLLPLLAAGIRICRLRHQLKRQHFEVKYRGVELEALYDVGLAIASTLELEPLYEEVLLRAVSLLDARRGALYLLAGDGERYRLSRTIGGDAPTEVAAADPEVLRLLGGAPDAEAQLLPGAGYHLAVAIECEGQQQGILVVADKESRHGVGPFPTSDRRTLSLFANQAAIALKNASLHLQALEKERLEREMQLAAEIQRQILPAELPEVPGFEVVGWNRPAREVGGDYYDVRHRSGQGLVLTLADVSGKGMPAALLVSTLHSALHLLLDRLEVGSELVSRLNRLICESSLPNKFITLFLAELSASGDRLRYLNAGHNPAFLVGGDGRLRRLPSGSLPVGMLPDVRARARAVGLKAGDLLCLYSDGITEAESPGAEEFGEERLIEVLLDARDRPLGEVAGTLAAAVRDFAQGQPQADDQTLVLMRKA